jgi:TonB family protein
MLSERLVNPLTGLGAVYNRLGLYDQAIKTFERAVRINHVNDGFYNFDQFKIYDGLTESYVGLQEAEDANFYQEAQLEIYQRRSGIDDPEIVPGLYKLASWYERTGQVELAMQSYRRADDILRKSGDRKLNPQRVAALEGMAHIFESVGNQSAAASVFKRALEVVDGQQEIDYATRATIQVRLGDLYTRSGKQTTADEHYSAAWRDLSRDDLHIDLRDRFFENPVRVSGRQLSRLAYAPGSRDEAPETLEDGYVLISYTVKSDGRTEDVKVVESEPPGMMDKSLVSTFMRSHFRARRIEGQAVDTDRLLYQLDFRYAKESGKNRSDGPLEYPEDSLDSDSEDDDGDRGGRLAYPEKVPD